MGRLDIDFAQAAGDAEGIVDVNISYEIIRQFSMQLYTNPRKAIEELVCNSYDAGATKCHIKTPTDKDDFLAVIDNGVSMDYEGLQDLWKIAVSPKNGLGDDRVDNNRQQIGKFGVGKLAAFSLGRRLTHVAMKNGEVRIVSVSSSDIHDHHAAGRPRFEIHKMKEKEARSVLEPYLRGLPKPWEEGWVSWTFAVVSEIDEDAAGRGLKVGFLRRMITHALPISSVFEVTLDGELVKKRTIKRQDIVVRMEITDRKFIERIQTALKHFWMTRLELAQVEDVPEDLFRCEIGLMKNPNKVDEDVKALIVPKLGPICGDAVITKRTLTTEKLAERGYSDNGFAVYARGRQVNPEDELFGITPRTHGYWRRFRAEVEIPKLDRILLVQRNTLAENHEELLLAREILRSFFEEARNRAEAIEETNEYEPEPFGARLRMLSPLGSSLALRGLAGDKYPEGGVESVSVEFAALGDHGAPAIYDSETSSILVNEEHPIMAAMADQGKMGKKLRYVLGEVVAGCLMASGYLKARGVEEGLVSETEDMIDDALRGAAGYVVDEIERHIQELDEASHEGDKRFERAIVKVFGDFRLTAIERGKSGETDAILIIQQAASKNLRIAVEAKGSKGKISHTDVSPTTVERHKQDSNCTHAIIVAREFQTKGQGDEESALVKETRDKYPIITTAAIARMLRLHPSRPFTHEKVKKILTMWTHPDEQVDMINRVWAELPDPGLMREVLTIAWNRQEMDERNYPDPGIILADKRIIKRGLSRDEVVRIIEAVQIATQMIIIRNSKTHEFQMVAHPDTILDALMTLPREPDSVLASHARSEEDIEG